MPKLNLDPDHISDFLNEPNYESVTTPSKLLPALPCRVTLTLDEVVPYDKNPRQTRNPNYESIKESIRNRGLDDEPTVTRRNIDEPFMIRNGGNTRLQILRELYEEYQQRAESADNEDEAQILRLKAEQFYRFEWNYKPWEGESSALIGHMVENEERGDMMYIEKSLAVKQLQEFFNKGEDKKLSSRKLAQKITEAGWSVTHTSIALMLYTAELNNYLKKALWSGLGSPQITRLRAIHRAYRKFCKSNNLLDEQVDTIWQETLLINDDSELNIDAIRRYGDQLISDILKIEYFTVTAEIDVILNGAHITVDRRPPLTPEQLAEQQQAFTPVEKVVDIIRTESESISCQDDLSETVPVTDNPLKEPDVVTEKMLEQQRHEIYVNVMALAMQYDLMDYINYNHFYGLGFYIEPLPDLVSEEITDHPEHINRNSIWLYLKQLCLHQMMQIKGKWPIPNELATSGSQLSYELFFSLNNHFHLMRFSDHNLQIYLNKIEQAIARLLQLAQQFYVEDSKPVIRLFDEFRECKNYEVVETN